ncbi:MAG: hypothetical protein Q9207_001210 [Kuettlingeria erythrocarpa]
MSASNGVPAPPPPQDCTLYYYVWPCGHWQWVGCTKCSLSPPTNYQVHLAHEHKQVQLPHPKHRCPTPGCGAGAAHEMEWIGIDAPNAQAAIQELTASYNSEEQIRERTENDVYAKEYPWRIDAAFADDDDKEGPSARNEAMMNVYRLGGRTQALESFLHAFPRRTGQDQQAAPGPSTSPLGSDQTTPRPQPAQPAISVDTTPRQPVPPSQQLEEGEIDESTLARFDISGRGSGSHGGGS